MHLENEVVFMGPEIGLDSSISMKGASVPENRVAIRRSLPMNDSLRSVIGVVGHGLECQVDGDVDVLCRPLYSRRVVVLHLEANFARSPPDWLQPEQMVATRSFVPLGVNEVVGHGLLCWVGEDVDVLSVSVNGD